MSRKKKGKISSQIIKYIVSLYVIILLIKEIMQWTLSTAPIVYTYTFYISSIIILGLLMFDIIWGYKK